MKYAKPQAATKLVSQAGRNVSRKARKPPQLKAFYFQNNATDNITQVDARTCLVQFGFLHYLEYVLLLTNNFLTYYLIN